MKTLKSRYSLHAVFWHLNFHASIVKIVWFYSSCVVIKIVWFYSSCIVVKWLGLWQRRDSYVISIANPHSDHPMHGKDSLHESISCVLRLFRGLIGT